MFEFFLKGGPVMWPILFCSIVSITFILEGLYNLHRIKKKIIVPDFVSNIKELLANGKIEIAKKLCQEIGGPLSNIIFAGITNYYKSFEEKERIVNRVGSGEVRKIEKNLSILSLIADISPLLGLLGTVTGLIKCFMKVQELGGRADPSALAGGIWEALITTVAGLSIAIPTLAFYHYFEKRVSYYVHEMRDVTQEILELTGNIKNEANSEETDDRI